MDGSPKDILDFWFAEESRPKWFVRDAAFDAEVARRLKGLYGRAAAGGLDGWSGTPRGALTLVILLDQAPRNMFRQSPQAFATDGRALALAKEAVARGFDAALAEEAEKHFLFMPFMHSESLDDQERCVALLEGIGANERTLYFARRHRDIIARFGRFPHRNEVLGRPSSAEELLFLKEPDSSF